MRATSLMLVVLLLAGGASAALGCPLSAGLGQDEGCCCQGGDSAQQAQEGPRIERSCCCRVADSSRPLEPIPSVQEARSRDLPLDLPYVAAVPSDLQPPRSLTHAHPGADRPGSRLPTLLQLHTLLLC